jgi:hypothetical protein
MMPLYWVLDADHNPRPASMLEWGIFFENIDNRRVAETTVGTSVVSTVFLGLDHGFHQGQPDYTPRLFETMIFAADGAGTGFARCGTWDGALEMHADAVRTVQRAEGR